MFATSVFDELPPDVQPGFITQNESEPNLGFDSEDNHLHGLYGDVTCVEGKHWRKNSEPDSEVRYAIAGQHIVVGGGGKRVAFYCDSFKPTTAFDIRTRRTVDVRLRRIGKSPDGQPVYPSFTCDAWRWCQDYTPDPSWMTATEWQGVLKELAPTIARDKALALGETQSHREREAQFAQSEAARRNPTSELGRAIAEGVASALAQLGLKPKN